MITVRLFNSAVSKVDSTLLNKIIMNSSRFRRRLWHSSRVINKNPNMSQDKQVKNKIKEIIKQANNHDNQFLSNLEEYIKDPRGIKGDEKGKSNTTANPSNGYILGTKGENIFSYHHATEQM
jgi:hypothetical protein